MEDQELLLPFEERMLRRVQEDIKNAESNLREYHKWCSEMYQFYYNAQNFDSLKKKNKFPSTAIQEDVDQFVADARDKLFYANRPCTIFGREESDKMDAEAKQEMMDYQDGEINIFSLVGSALRDVALYRACAFKVDYEEKFSTEWESYQDPVPLTDENNQPILDEQGNFFPSLDENGEPIIDAGWRLTKIPTYKGAVVNRLDPMNVFWTQDKKHINDEHPIMVKGNLSKHDLKKPYFIKKNIEELKTEEADNQYEDPTWEKKRISGESPSSTGSTKNIGYVEWQGMVDKKEVYQYMLETNQVPEEELEKHIEELKTAEDGERCWAICGVGNNLKVIQLRAKPFKKIAGPNIIIGIMSPGEDSMLGDSISRKIEAVQRAEEEVYGMLSENIKQSINAFWIINRSALTNVNGQPKINKAGGILETNTDVNNVAKRVDQPRVAPDIYTLLSMFKQARQDQGGLQDNIQGKGDPSAETLGEARQALSYASLRLRDYLKTFEDSFIRPLYEMRNDINTEFLDSEYVYRVVGESGLEWRQISPEAIRTPVDFVCESATRETNRSVIIQQFLQLVQLAPLTQQMSPELASVLGPATRPDLMLADLCETGFAMSQDKIKRYFPYVALEDQGIDVNQIAAQVSRMSMLAAPTAPSPNQEMPQPTSEDEAIRDMEARNNVQI